MKFIDSPDDFEEMLRAERAVLFISFGWSGRSSVTEQTLLKWETERNGPNLMVKAIADQQKVHTPTFFGYVLRYTIPYMIPMLATVWWLFFRTTN